MVRATISYVRRHHIALLALLVAMGGTAYAADSINGRDVVDGSLKGKDLKNNTIQGRDVEADALKGAHIDESTLETGIVSATVRSNNPPEPTLENAHGIASVERFGPGVFALNLEEGLEPCNFVVSPINNTNNSGGSGGTAGYTAGPPQILVTTRAADGSLIDINDQGLLGFSVVGVPGSGSC